MVKGIDNMTALNYILTKDAIMVSMDTLTTGIDITRKNKDKINVNFTTKMYILPHFNTVICGIGSAEIKKDWYNYASKNIISRDIEYLNELITEKLLEFDEKYNFEHNTSIYQFGYNEGMNEFVGFIYSKENKYESQKLNILEGDVCKIDIIPMISPNAYDEIINTTKLDIVEGYEKFFIDIMKEQKREDDLKTLPNRAGIGGDIHLLHMTKDFYSYKRIYRFDDYDEVYNNLCKTRLK